MDSDELKQLRQYYHSLLGLQNIYNGLTTNVTHVEFSPLDRELHNLAEDYPELIPPYNKDTMYSHTHSGNVYYKLIAVKSFLAIVLGRLQIAIEQSSDTPVTEKRQFTFVNDFDLKSIVERDYLEIQKAYVLGCWKSVIILSGGAIEAILTDLLLANETLAKSAKSTPKTTDITRWDLSNLIDVSVELNLVSPGVEKLSHSVREYRNLVHPGNEVRSNLKFDAEEAKIALEVLNIVHRELSS